MKYENFSPKRNHILSISGYKLSQFTFHPRKSGLFERTEIFFLRPGLLAVGGTIVARDVIHPLLDQLLRDPRLYLNRDRKMSRLQAFLVLYECSFKKPRVFPSLCFVCESMLLEAVCQKHKVTLYEKDAVLPSCYVLFSPGLVYTYIYIYISLEKIRLCSGTRTITLRTMRQFTSVPSGNHLSDSNNEKRRIIVVQRRTRDGQSVLRTL